MQVERIIETDPVRKKEAPLLSNAELYIFFATHLPECSQWRDCLRRFKGPKHDQSCGHGRYGEKYGKHLKTTFRDQFLESFFETFF